MTIYEEYKTQVQEQMSAEEDTIQAYWNDIDPKFVSASYSAIKRLEQLKIIDKFLDENKRILDK